MTTSKFISAPAGSTIAPVLGRVGRALSGRRGLVVLATATLGLGAALNWSWLFAAGVAPVLLSVLPCVAMCALGLCMNRFLGNPNGSAAVDQSPDDPAVLSDTHPAGPACCTASSLPDRHSADASEV